MNRREFLTTSAALAAGAALVPAAPLLAQPTRPQPITRWNIQVSEGLDAIAFLGALSGAKLYLASYGAEAAEFGARLPGAVRSEIAALAQEAEQGGFGLLWPNLCTIFSGADASTLDAVLLALSDPESRLKPPLRASAYWDPQSWTWFSLRAGRLHAVLTAMRTARFAEYRATLVGSKLKTRVAELRHELSAFDIIPLHEKLTGRSFDPEIQVVLLYFSKPHGVRVQGQRFLQATDWPLTITLRNAAHEILHPPIDMHGGAASAALAELKRNSLITRIVRDHDPQWGYTTLDGYLNEDICQALDQIISEKMGFGRNPADRWRAADDGIHVLAAGIYGLMRQDGWHVHGGNLEEWIKTAAAKGRFKPAVLHPVAARVLERPMAELWPLA